MKKSRTDNHQHNSKVDYSLTRFTLLLLQLFQRHMWSNHGAAWAYANDSGMNVDF